MANDMSYDTLWQLAQKERQSNELQPLSKTFYEDTKEFINTLSKGQSEEDENTKKNAIKLVNEIHERRKQKILIYVAYKRQLPQPSIPTEQAFYNELVEYASKNRLDAQGKANKQTMTVLQTIPEIILPSGNKLGPLERDQTIEISANEDDIRFLISNTICKRL
jgi:hypothetical protein